MDSFFYGIAHLFEKAFRLIERLHNVPNKLLIAICAVAMIAWIGKMSKYNKEAEQNGTLK